MLVIGDTQIISAFISEPNSIVPYGVTTCSDNDLLTKCEIPSKSSLLLQFSNSKIISVKLILNGTKEENISMLKKLSGTEIYVGTPPIHEELCNIINENEHRILNLNLKNSFIEIMCINRMYSTNLRITSVSANPLNFMNVEIVKGGKDLKTFFLLLCFFVYRLVVVCLKMFGL